MIHIYSCKDYAVHASVQTDAEANKILKGKPFHAGYCMFACESGHGSRIIGDDETGIQRTPGEMLPYHERCGSALTGREE